MSEWRPIETAPRDGSSILVCVTYNVGDDEWQTETWVDWATPDDEWPVYLDRVDLPFRPTHWMPLPSPPDP